MNEQTIIMSLDILVLNDLLETGVIDKNLYDKAIKVITDDNNKAA